MALFYSNGTLAFARVKGEPSACKPEKCKLLERQKSIIFNKSSYPMQLLLELRLSTLLNC